MSIAASVESGGASRRGVQALAELSLGPAEEPLHQVLLVVLRAQQLASQLGPGVVRCRDERRIVSSEQQPAHAAHPVSPAWRMSSTSYASLRIRWSRYCSEVTAEVKGVANAAETTCASDWLTIRISSE